MQRTILSMLPYLILVIILIFMQIESKGSYHDDVKKLSFSICMLFLFAAIRGNGDGDYFAYRNSIGTISSINAVLHNTTFEIGYNIIAFFISFTGLHSQFIIALMNAISLSCIWVLVKKYSSNSVLSVFLFLPFFFQYDMHAARTAVSIGISTLSLRFIISRNPAKYFLFILLAASFHRACLILIPFYFFGQKRIGLKLGLISIAFCIVMIKIVDINSIVVSILNAVDLVSIANRYNDYVGNVKFGYPFSLFDPRLIISVGVFIVSSIVINKPSKAEIPLINSAWLASVVMVVFSDTTAFVTRFSVFYTIYTIILIPLILRRIHFTDLGVMEYKSIKQIKRYFPAKVFVVLFFTVYLCFLLNGYVEYRVFFLT